MALGKWVPIVAWVPEAGGLDEELAAPLGTQFSCLLILDYGSVQRILAFIMDQVEMKITGLLKVTVVSIFNISY